MAFAFIYKFMIFSEIPRINRLHEGNQVDLVSIESLEYFTVPQHPQEVIDIDELNI